MQSLYGYSVLGFCMSYIIVIIIIIISIMSDPSGRQRSVLIINLVSWFFFFCSFSYLFFVCLFLLNSYSSNGCVKYEHLH